MLVAVTMVRDEQDIIGYTLTHLLAEGVDHIIVADNQSTDQTRPILEALADGHPVTVLDDPEQGYYQAKKMTRLAHMAYGMGATWVLPFDADELWYSPAGLLADVLWGCQADVIQATEHKHWPTHHDPPDVPNPFLAMPYREQTPNRLAKVVFRAHPQAALHMGNHDVERPGERMGGLLEMRHFPYRSFPQFAHKVKVGREAYEATNLHTGYGTHWRTMGALSDDELHDEWDLLVEGRPGLPWLQHQALVHDPAPVRA